MCVNGFIVDPPPPTHTHTHSVYPAFKANDQVRRFINIHLRYNTVQRKSLTYLHRPYPLSSLECNLVLFSCPFSALGCDLTLFPCPLSALRMNYIILPCFWLNGGISHSSRFSSVGTLTSACVVLYREAVPSAL